MQQLDALAQRYTTRPALLVGITAPHLAWMIDEAAALAGSSTLTGQPGGVPENTAHMSLVDGKPLVIGRITRHS